MMTFLNAYIILQLIEFTKHNFSKWSI